MRSILWDGQRTMVAKWAAGEPFLGSGEEPSFEHASE
jgi:hypothetical protein